MSADDEPSFALASGPLGVGAHSRGFEIVVAADLDGGIGKEGALPWKLPGEMKQFVAVTRDSSDGTNTVIMGRTTWESIPARFRPLAGRHNVVLSRRADFLAPGAILASSLKEALRLAPDNGLVFVIGGGDVYREALAHPLCRLVHLTRVESRFDCDVFLPSLEPEYVLDAVTGIGQDGEVRYRFERWRKKRACTSTGPNG